MMARVLVPGHFLDDLASTAEHLRVELIPYDRNGEPLPDAEGADALFRWWISVEQGDRLMGRYPIRWVHTGSAGVDHILTPAFLRSGAVLTNSAGVHAPSIAEWVALAILAMQKGLGGILANQGRRAWEKVERAELAGTHAVILGAGRIASEVSRRLRPFSIAVTAVSRSGKPDPRFDTVVSAEKMRDVLAGADWLVVALPLTPATRSLINGEILSILPPRCRLINVARGEIVDQTALLAALKNGSLAGAALDVFEEEPLPEDSPFWTMENVIVLPHTTWRSPEVRARQLSLFEDNLGRFVRGEPLLNVVDPTSGY
jgi:phosphoglycerate dehydrogenase-like enzyme